MKIRTADLTGAQLDYHTARAQGILAECLEIRRVPRTDTLICVHMAPPIPGWMNKPERALSYSTNWQLTGELIEQHMVCVDAGDGNFEGNDKWEAHLARNAPVLAHEEITGPTPQVAICRAVVRAAFGDEVEEVAVCE